MSIKIVSTVRIYRDTTSCTYLKIGYLYFLLGILFVSIGIYYFYNWCYLETRIYRQNNRQRSQIIIRVVIVANALFLQVLTFCGLRHNVYIVVKHPIYIYYYYYYHHQMYVQFTHKQIHSHYTQTYIRDNRRQRPSRNATAHYLLVGQQTCRNRDGRPMDELRVPTTAAALITRRPDTQFFIRTRRRRHSRTLYTFYILYMYT